MNPKIKVSIVIPIYNVQLYLRQCLDSVLSQSLQEIEVICVNDGSTDGSLQVLNEYAANEKIIIIDQVNKGAGLARNKGILTAKGKYIAFIDPDDYYANDNALETLYTFAEREDTMICCGNVKDIRGNYMGKRFLENKLMSFTGLQNCGYHCSAIYNLKFLRQNEIYYPNYRRFQDPPFLTKAMLKAKVFFAVNIDVYIYRVGHKTLNITEKMLINVINGVRDILNMIYDDGNTLSDFALYVFDGNQEFIIQHSCDRMDSVSLREAIDELNIVVGKVLGEKHMLTEKKIVEYRYQCTSICEAIRDKKPIIIYGAGTVGRRIVNEIHSLGGDIIGVAVSDVKDNPNLIEGFQVKSIVEYTRFTSDAYVIIATGAKLQEEIKALLAGYHFEKVSVATSSKLDYVMKMLE